METYKIERISAPVEVQVAYNDLMSCYLELGLCHSKLMELVNRCKEMGVDLEPYLAQEGNKNKFTLMRTYQSIQNVLLRGVLNL